MLREAVSSLNMSLLTNIGMGIFLLVFFLICLRAILMPKKDVDHMANLPNNEDSN